MDKPALPVSDVPSDLMDWVRQVINLNTPAGFIAAYNHNLIVYQNKGVAYEATEQLYERFYQKRRYLDKEVFISTLSQQKKRRGKSL